MSAEAYAGFLKLLLTPATRVPLPSADLEAYLQYISEREPLSETVRMVIGQPTVEAA
jgi:hypothetical protein